MITHMTIAALPVQNGFDTPAFKFGGDSPIQFMPDCTVSSINLGHIISVTLNLQRAEIAGLTAATGIKSRAIEGQGQSIRPYFHNFSLKLTCISIFIIQSFGHD